METVSHELYSRDENGRPDKLVYEVEVDMENFYEIIKWNGKLYAYDDRSGAYIEAQVLDA